MSAPSPSFKVSPFSVIMPFGDLQKAAATLLEHIRRFLFIIYAANSFNIPMNIIHPSLVHQSRQIPFGRIKAFLLIRWRKAVFFRMNPDLKKVHFVVIRRMYSWNVRHHFPPSCVASPTLMVELVPMESLCASSPFKIYDIPCRNVHACLFLRALYNLVVIDHTQRPKTHTFWFLKAAE